MGLFVDESHAAPLSPDPEGGEVEPALVAGLAPSPTRVGLYGDHGNNEQAALADKAQDANLVALTGKVYDGLAQLEIAVRRLNKKSLVLGPFIWTTADTVVRGTIPVDRLPINTKLARILSVISDTSAGVEVITITDLLPIPFRVTPAQTMNFAVTDDVGMRVDVPIKSESFTITKQGGGAFTSIGALYLHFEEGDLL